VLSEPSLEGLAGTGDPLEPVVRYLLAGDGRWRSPVTDRRRLELAPRLAQLFSEYAYSRPEWIRAWMREPGGPLTAEPAVERWQSALYRRARAVGDAAQTTLAERLVEPSLRLAAERLPSRAFVFGVSYVARVFHEALARAYGVAFESVSSGSNLAAALDRGLARPGLSIVRACVEPRGARAFEAELARRHGIALEEARKGRRWRT
jgi:hypothetical protein